MSDKNNQLKKKIGIIGMTGLPARYGGWDKLVENMTYSLRKDFDFLVYCSAFLYPDKTRKYKDVSLKYIYLRATGVQSVVYDIVCMLHAIKKLDILVILGVSGCTFLPFLRLISTKKIIVNIDGIEWKRGKWRRFSKWFLKLSERMAVKYADVIIADNLEIYKYVKSEYNVESELIAYGGDHVLKVSLDDPALSHEVRKYSFIKDKYAFCVCRIEPENNLDTILEAFVGQDYNLAIVGNWNYSQYGRALKIKYSSYSNIFLYDPIYQQKSLDVLRSNTSLYIHGHSVGGTNPALVEAMNLGLSIIAFDVCYNRETTENKAEYFSNINELQRIISSDNDYDKNAKSMLEIAQRRYRWNIISDQYRIVFID